MKLIFEIIKGSLGRRKNDNENAHLVVLRKQGCAEGQIVAEISPLGDLKIVKKEIEIN